MSSKTDYIDKVLGFYFEEPFINAASLFPSPDGEIEKWYKISRVFDAVTKAELIEESEKRNLFDLVEDACCEIIASAFIGEPPNTSEKLGDGYDIPDEFVSKWQLIIWKIVLDEYAC